MKLANLKRMSWRMKTHQSVIRRYDLVHSSIIDRLYVRRLSNRPGIECSSGLLLRLAAKVVSAFAGVLRTRRGVRPLGFARGSLLPKLRRFITPILCRFR